MSYDKQAVRSQFKYLFENSLDLIYIHDLKGKFLDANEITLFSLGYEEEEIQEITFKDLIDKDQLEKAFNAIKEIRDEGRQTTLTEYKIKTKDGNYVYVETYGIPLKKSGRIYAILGVGKNVTDRKITAQKLKDSEELFKALYKEGPLPTYTWQKIDNDFILINFNNAAEIDTKGEVRDFLGTKASVMYKERLDIIEDLNTCFDERTNINKEMDYMYHYNGERKILSVNYGFVNPDLIIVQVEDITERKLAEEKLKESEKKYREMINNLDVGFYQVSLEGIVINHNPKYNKILGYDISENLVGTDVARHWEDESERETYLQKLLEEEFAHNYILRAKKITGENIVLQLNSHIVKNIGKEPIVEGTFLDITEKFALEKKVRQSEQKYRDLFESAPYSIGLVDLDGRIVDCNSATEHFLSVHTREDLIGATIKEVFSYRDENKKIIGMFEDSLQDMLEGKTVQTFEFPLTRSIGGIIWISVSGSIVRIDDEPLIQFIIQDISERKKTEQNLIDSESKYRHLFEESPYSIVLINSKGEITDANPNSEMMFGYTKEEVIGKNFKDLGLLHPNFLSNLLDLFKRFVRGEEMHRIDIQMYKKDGTLFWTNLQASLINIGKDLYVQAIFIDVTSRKEAELLINEEIKKLKDLDNIRKNLISRVSHELKTPLVSVSGGCELILSMYREKLDEEVRNIMELIEKGGRRLRKLVDDLIDISRIEYERFELEKQPTNLSELIREITNEMMYLVRERKLDLQLLLPEKLEINIDKIRIEQVIMNLLSNAIKNSPPNGKITISLKKRGIVAEINVKDTGIGLTKEEMDFLFTRFGKLERYGEGLEFIDIQGSGLGLFISKEIIDLHEGEIRAESKGRNQGSTFIVKLPLDQY